MWQELWDAFKEWAKEAWNWLHAFFQKIYKKIKSWIEELRVWILNQLKKKDEVIITRDQQILIHIREKNPKTHTGQELAALSVKNDRIDQVDDYRAEEVTNRSELDDLLDEEDGTVRFKN